MHELVIPERLALFNSESTAGRSLKQKEAFRSCSPVRLVSLLPSRALLVSLSPLYSFLPVPFPLWVHCCFWDLAQAQKKLSNCCSVCRNASSAKIIKNRAPQIPPSRLITFHVSHDQHPHISYLNKRGAQGTQIKLQRPQEQ